MMSEEQFDHIKQAPYAIFTFIRAVNAFGVTRYSHFHCDIRNPKGKTAWYMSDAGEVRVACQMDNERAETYGWEYRFEKHGGLTLPDIEGALPVMKKVCKGLTKRYQELGNHQDFAEYALEIMRILKVKVVFMNVEHADGSEPTRDPVFNLPHFELPKEGGQFLQKVRWAEQVRIDRPKAA